MRFYIACNLLLDMQGIIPMKQIRGVFEDNLGIILLFLDKNICCGYSLELPERGDSNEHPQHTFLWRTIETYPLIITKYPPYLFHRTFGGLPTRIVSSSALL